LKEGLAFSTPTKNIVYAILKSLGETGEELRCSICNENLSNLKNLGAIYPYKSALISCNKLECILKCRDMLISKELPERK